MKTSTGIIEGDPEADGYYLNFAWSARIGTAAESINNLLKIPQAKNAAEAMKYFCRAFICSLQLDNGRHRGQYRLSARRTLSEESRRALRGFCPIWVGMKVRTGRE